MVAVPSSVGAGPSVEIFWVMTADADTTMLTIDEVRSRLKVSVSTVRRLVRAGKLPAYLVGGQLRFKPAEVTAYVDGQRVEVATLTHPTAGLRGSE